MRREIQFWYSCVFNCNNFTKCCKLFPRKSNLKEYTLLCTHMVMKTVRILPGLKGKCGPTTIVIYSHLTFYEMHMYIPKKITENNQFQYLDRSKKFQGMAFITSLLQKWNNINFKAKWLSYVFCQYAFHSYNVINLNSLEVQKLNHLL